MRSKKGKVSQLSFRPVAPRFPGGRSLWESFFEARQRIRILEYQGVFLVIDRPISKNIHKRNKMNIRLVNDSSPKMIFDNALNHP